ncbi:MAG TPA: threonine-phosphate decarboxylase CobD [Syntrophomonadaceae bacterium]|nr:threonine-phosphate decarboxylase CobD [Syntrophomonadaceae bacterium]
MRAERFMANKDMRFTHGGNIWAAAQKWGTAADRLLDFSANINPLGPSPQALKAIRESLAMIQHYPEPGGETCKQSLSRYLSVEPDHLVLGNGGSELIYLLGRMFYKNRVLLLAPCFSEYGQGIINPRIHRITLNKDQNFILPAARIIRTMQKNDLLFIANPNNPTGNLFDPEGLLSIVQAGAEQEAMVVIDEAFLDFAGGDEISLRHQVEENPNLVVVSSLTKFFAIPGLRLGYAAAHPSLIKQMEQLLPAWRINTLALEAAKASLDDRKYIEQTVAVVQREREFLQVGLSSLPGLVVYPGASNFILVDGEGGRLSARDLQERLAPLGILIRSCQNFNNLTPFFFRLAVKTREENQKLLSALRSVYDENYSNTAWGNRVECSTEISGSPGY